MEGRADEASGEFCSALPTVIFQDIRVTVQIHLHCQLLGGLEA